MRIAGSTLGTPEQTVPEALELFADPAWTPRR